MTRNSKTKTKNIRSSTGSRQGVVDRKCTKSCVSCFGTCRPSPTAAVSGNPWALMRRSHGGPRLIAHPIARIPRHRHRHPRRHPREDRRENVGVSFSLPREQLRKIARVGRVGEDPGEEVGVGVGVVECELICA